MHRILASGLAVVALSCSSDDDGGGTSSTTRGLTCEVAAEVKVSGTLNGGARSASGHLSSYALQQVRQPSSLDIGWADGGSVHFEWSGLQPNDRAVPTTGTLELSAAAEDAVPFGSGSTVTIGSGSGTFHVVGSTGTFDGCWLRD